MTCWPICIRCEALVSGASLSAENDVRSEETTGLREEQLGSPRHLHGPGQFRSATRLGRLDCSGPRYAR